MQQAEELYRAQGRTAGAAIALVERLRLTPDPDPDLLAEQAEILTAAGLPRDAANAWLTSAAASRDRGDLASARARWARVPTIVNGDPVAALEAQARMDLLDGQHQRAAQWIASALQVVDQRAAVAAAPDLRQRISARRIRFEQLARQLNEHDAPHRQLDALLRGRPRRPRSPCPRPPPPSSCGRTGATWRGASPRRRRTRRRWCRCRRSSWRSSAPCAKPSGRPSPGRRPAPPMAWPMSPPQPAPR
ncbi:hypothetical protein BN13_1540011 [Nostocoides jenkinsii Ben 74]|uniref:Uncharacterized protein n=1 Tax=Nostocoides jenkinsii Ben 74 TaxID=1193518 RepID=A0A077M8U2_9MICO|nr:hypothetical protein BN13_1540011 [Tetrasphaera jenkinsii Ben 74]